MVSGVEGQFGEVVCEPGMRRGPKFQLQEAAVYSHCSLPFGPTASALERLHLYNPAPKEHQHYRMADRTNAF